MRWTFAFPTLLLASATTVLATINFNQFHPDLVKKQIEARNFRTASQEAAEKRQIAPVRQPLFLNNNNTRMSPVRECCDLCVLISSRICCQWLWHPRGQL